MNTQSTALGPIFTLLGIGTWTLARYPHTLKYFKLDFLPFHFSYGITYVFEKVTLLSISFVERIVFPYKFCGKPELITNAFIISIKVRFFLSAFPLD